MDSIYTQCSKAARRLAAKTEPFDESSVVREAATDAWSESEFAEADRHAPQVLAALYRNSALVRFGTVLPENAPLTGEPDYVRHEGHILYGRFATWERKPLITPNGEFHAILYRQDPIYKNGRRKASERNDFAPWAEQVPADDADHPDVIALRREIARLQSALTAEEARADRLERENERLREQAATLPSRVTPS